MSFFKLLSDNCKFENNLSSEETNSLKSLMRNKNITADQGNTFVITDIEKYIEGVKFAISLFNKFVEQNITPDKYFSYWQVPN